MSRHVAVVGGGVIGLCSAHYLLESGFRVTVLEREPSPGEGCSYGNGGIVVPSHFVPLAAPGMIATGLRMMRDRSSPFGVERLTDPLLVGWLARFARSATKAHVERAAPVLRDLNLESRRLYADLVREMPEVAGYAHRGLLMLCRTHAAHEGEAALAAHAERLGLRARVLSPAELREVEPDLDIDAIGGVHFEDDAHLSPGAFMRALRSRFLAAGGDIRDGAELRGFVRRDGKIAALDLSIGEFEADTFVLATGAWSGELASGLGLRLPMVAGRGFGLTSTQPPQRPRMPAILTEARVAVTPMPDGVRFVGTMELARPKVVAESPRIARMRRSISDYYPAYRPEHLNGPVWCGLRPCSPDGLPYLGALSSAPNVVVATGHAMMGMSLGPVTGLLVSQIVAGEAPSIDLRLLSPERHA